MTNAEIEKAKKHAKSSIMTEKEEIIAWLRVERATCFDKWPLRFRFIWLAMRGGSSFLIDSARLEAAREIEQGLHKMEKDK
jgi:hypothetical protein